MAIIDVVKFEGPPDVFAWRYPNQELGTWTQLIVHESQEAILYKGGQALDSFSAGRHTLSTANIPILSNIINLPFGGKSPFTAEVWFINKMRSLDVKWGTSAPIQLQDPKYNIIVSVRAFGQFGVQISNPRKFLGKMPSCGYDYPADAKVCAECGAQLPIPCRECSHLLDPGAKFCPNCGASHKLQCTNCNHEVKTGQKFCMECGHRLMESESGDPS